MTMTAMLRQGDVLLIPVATLPSDVEVVQEGGKVILALGEKSFHHHHIDSDCITLLRSPSAEQFVNAAQAILRAPQERTLGTRSQTRGYIDVKDFVELKHEEHAPIPVPPGKYKVVIQREYVAEDRSSKEARELANLQNWRNVRD